MSLMQTLANDRINLKPVGPKNALPTGIGLFTLTTSFTRPNNTTAYAAGQLIANDTTAGNVVPLQFDASAYLEGGTAPVVQGVRVRIPGQTTGVTTGLILYLFSALPIPTVGDGGALLSGSTFASTGYGGFMGASGTTSVNSFFSDGLMTFTSAAQPTVSLAATSSVVYGLLSAAGAWTPSAVSQTISVELFVRP